MATVAGVVISRIGILSSPFSKSPSSSPLGPVSGYIMSDPVRFVVLVEDSVEVVLAVVDDNVAATVEEAFSRHFAALSFMQDKGSEVERHLEALTVIHCKMFESELFAAPVVLPDVEEVEFGLVDEVES